MNNFPTVDPNLENTVGYDPQAWEGFSPLESPLQYCADCTRPLISRIILGFIAALPLINVGLVLLIGHANKRVH